MLLLPPFATHPDFLSTTQENLSTFAKNEEVLSALLVSVAKWRSLIDDILRSYAAATTAFFSRRPTGGEHSVQDEIQLWERQVASLGISVQLRSDLVRLLIRILTMSDDPEGRTALEELDAAAEHLHAAHAEACDASASLEHLTPYAAHLTRVLHGEIPLGEAIDTVTPLFSALRMVWTCSAMYGGATASGRERFWQLLTRVVGLITSCVRA
eukprot:Rhum_TRINITY_DN25258_c0_g1::Rhum_TRINITY_DN25258_c0_g1_i1::g.181657::m.181657